MPRCDVNMADLASYRDYLSRSNFSNIDQAMLWAAVLVAFFGLLRASEFLAPSADTVDPNRTLTWSAMTFGPKKVIILLKRTKTAQDGHGGVVELQQSTGNICPVMALQEHARLSFRQHKSLLPVFTYQSGKHLTRDEMTRILRQALQTQSVSSHSLRIGGATHMAKCGASDALIKRAGRWRSSASDRYIRQAAGMPLLSMQ